MVEPNSYSVGIWESRNFDKARELPTAGTCLLGQKEVPQKPVAKGHHAGSVTAGIAVKVTSVRFSMESESLMSARQGCTVLL